MGTKKVIQEEDINFFDEEIKIKNEAIRKEKRMLFKIVLIGASSVALTSFGVYSGVNSWLESKHKEKIDKVKSIASDFKSNNLIEYLKNYKKSLDNQYTHNVTDMLDYDQHKDLIKLLNLNDSYMLLKKNNNIAYSEAINEYKKTLNNFQQIIESSENEKTMNLFIENSSFKDIIKVENYLGFGKYDSSSNNYEQQIKATSLGENLFKLKKINLEIKNDINDITNVKDEMLATIMLKIKSGDYNLNETQKALAQDMTESTNSEMEDLVQVRNSLKDSEFSKDFTDDDLTNAKKSLSELEASLIARVAEDKKNIEKMITKVSEGQVLKSGDAGSTISEASPLATNTVSNQNSGNHWGAFEYYLLYNWLAGGSKSSPAMIASHTSAFAQTSGKNLEKKNGNFVAPIVKNSIGSSKLNSTGMANNMYNSRIPNSYISNSLPQKNSSKVGNSTVLQARKNLETIKERGRQAIQSRKASIARVQAARAQTSRDSSAKKIGSRIGSSSSRGRRR